MPYKVKHHNAFKKGFKNINPANKEIFLDECDNIQANPAIGEIMSGNFRKFDILKASVKGTNPQYRILYKVYTCETKNETNLTCSGEIVHESKNELIACNGYIDFIICGPREMFNNFYKLPLDKIKKYL